MTKENKRENEVKTHSGAHTLTNTWLRLTFYIIVCVHTISHSRTKNINLCVVFIPEPLKNSFCLVVVAVFVFALISWIGFSRFFLDGPFCSLLSFFTPSTQMRKKPFRKFNQPKKKKQKKERGFGQMNERGKNFSDTYIVSSRAGFCYLNAKHNASKIFRRRKRSTPIDSSININVFKMLLAHSFWDFSFSLRMPFAVPPTTTIKRWEVWVRRKTDRSNHKRKYLFARISIHLLCSMKILFIFLPPHFFWCGVIYIFYIVDCVLVLRLLIFLSICLNFVICWATHTQHTQTQPYTLFEAIVFA